MDTTTQELVYQAIILVVGIAGTVVLTGIKKYLGAKVAEMYGTDLRKK